MAKVNLIQVGYTFDGRDGFFYMTEAWTAQLERCESLMECMLVPVATSTPLKPFTANFEENAEPFFTPVKDIPRQALLPHEMQHNTPDNNNNDKNYNNNLVVVPLVDPTPTSPL